MSSNRYQVYIDQCTALASTIVVKSMETVDAQNQYVTDYFGPDALDTSDPTSWKYYMTISGQYHPTDQLMYVISLDTLEKILFSKENLAIHRATFHAYGYGTRQYRELITAYPNQEMLILGILYPVNISDAIAASEGQILGYPSALIEENEYSLISKLQTWINGYKSRWTNAAFGITDKLYPAASLGIMYLNLLPAILNFRLEACKTNEAHSYHVRQYLASHGVLDTYLEQMTLKQALFFYRNIAYIERNSGKREIFDLLVEHIMTERGLPVAECVMHHNLLKQPTEVYPEIVFDKKALNDSYSANLEFAIKLPDLLHQENDIARDNRLYEYENLHATREAMENSRSNTVLTKVIDSSVIDYSNSTPYTLEEVLMSHWLSLSMSGHYQAFINVMNPATSEIVSLDTKEAYIVAWYAFCKMNGVTLDLLPTVMVKHVQRTDPIATVSNLMSVVDSRRIDSSMAVQALSMQPTINTIISTEAFYETGVAIYKAIQMQRGLVSTQEHHVKRGMIEVMIEQIYSDNTYTLGEPGEHFSTWFAERHISIASLSATESEILYQSIVDQATGVGLNRPSSLKQMQSAMARMFKQLSSYSIQLLTKINDTNITRTDWTSVRVGDISITNKRHEYCPDFSADVFNMETAAHQQATYPMGAIIPKWIGIMDRISIAKQLELNVNMADYKERHQQKVTTVTTRISLTTPLVPNSLGIPPVLGLDTFLALTPEQQKTIKALTDGGYNGIMPSDDPTRLNEIAEQAYIDDRYVTPGYVE